MLEAIAKAHESIKNNAALMPKLNQSQMAELIFLSLTVLFPVELFYADIRRKDELMHIE